MFLIPGMSKTRLRATRLIMAGLALILYPILSSLLAQPAPSPQLPDLPELAPETVPAETFTLNFAWNSRYVSEGRDNLEDGGIASVAVDLDRPSPLPFMDTWHFSSWFAESLATPYTELNLSLGSSFAIGEMDGAIGHTWLDFNGPDASDHEFDLQLGIGLFDEFDFSSAFVYSTEAEGTFIELVASSDIVREKFILTPYILLGINRGYIPEEPETFNNLQFGLTATTSLSQEMEASFHLAATTGLENIFWTGVSVSFGSFPHALPQDPTRRQH